MTKKRKLSYIHGLGHGSAVSPVHAECGYPELNGENWWKGSGLAGGCGLSRLVPQPRLFSGHVNTATKQQLIWALQEGAWAMLREKQRALGLRVSRGCRAVPLAPTGPTSFPVPPSALPWAAGQAPATGRSDICPRTQQGAAELFLPRAPTA